MEFSDRCWIVWVLGDTNSYRCFNSETADEAVDEWVKKYGPSGTYDVLASLYRSDGGSGPQKECQKFHVTHEIRKAA